MPVEQGGRPLSWIEGWHAIAEAHRIFGIDPWNLAKAKKGADGDLARSGFGCGHLAC